MPRIERRSALTETIGIGKGDRDARGLRAGRRHLRHRPEPGHLSPAHADRAAEGGERNGCKIVSVNPLPETGMIRFKHPQEPLSACSARGRRSRCLFLPVRINGDVALLKGIMKEMLETDGAAGGKRARPRLHRASTRRGSTAFVARSATRRVGRDRRSRAACRASRSPTRREIAMRVRAHDLLLGDGAHAAPQRRRQHPGGRELLLLRGQIGRRGRRRSARCAGTATCRAIARWASGRR